MKPYRFLLLVCLLVMACENTTKDSYTISIESEKLHNGLRSYIKERDSRGKERVIDTAIAMNKRITFEGSIGEPTVGFLSIDGINGSLMFFIENDRISIEMDSVNLANSRITGSKLNDELQAYNTDVQGFYNSFQPYNIQYREAKTQNDVKKMDSLRTIMIDIRRTADEYPLNYINQHPNSLLSLYLFDAQISKRRPVGYEDLLKAYENLDSTLLNSGIGKQLQEKMEIRKAEFKKEQLTAIGAKAPDFSAATPSGEQLALSEVYTKGKITIVDFWAAWCGPCRRENPNLVRTYNKYHDKGLEIIGVSLDGNRSQTDPKAAWVKAIEDDKLDWHHVSKLQYFGPIAKQYNVNAIPAMFILDNEGKIVGKNLRGMALENKVAELLTD